jgi:hypothetical protein
MKIKNATFAGFISVIVAFMVIATPFSVLAREKIQISGDSFSKEVKQSSIRVLGEKTKAFKVNVKKNSRLKESFSNVSKKVTNKSKTNNLSASVSNIPSVNTPPSSRILPKERVGSISFWIGKVNMHKEVGGVWQADPDQESGAFADKLEYCKKFWPETGSVEYVGVEMISGWQDAGGIGSYTSTKPVYGCFDGLAEVVFEDNIAVTPTPINPNEYKVLVVLADYLDSEYSDDFTVSDAEEWFGGYPLRDFFYEQSYGKMDISADVIGWHTTQMIGEGSGCNPTTHDNSGNFSPLDNQGMIDYLNQHNVSFADYDHFIVAIDCKGATWGGYSQELNLNGETIEAAVVKGVGEDGPSLHFIAHEMGHDLYGIQSGHANGIDCETVDYNAEDCETVGYGNYFDAMGSWVAYAHHFRAQMKEQLGWFDSSGVVEVTHSGTYTINPLETVDGVKMVKIKPWYAPRMTHYVEFRNGSGFNGNMLSPDLASNTEGLFVYKQSKGFESIYSLIDATPTSESWGVDIKNTTLNEGMTFEDSIWGVSIQTLSSNQNEITFQVNLDQSQYVSCDGPHLAPVDFVLNPPDLPTLSPASGEMARHYLSVNISLDNPEPTCLNQEYSIEIADDAGLNIQDQTGTKIVYLEGERKWYFQVGIPEGVTGTKTLLFNMVNEASGEVTQAAYSFYFSGGGILGQTANTYAY